ncbi:hypothetical protein MKW94_016026 [Papaver nudicaule]|uniref:DUF3615 domain-containing protein n=1 Tax=Papaver nudicaule TaxID=74823 RepID=A0AA42AY79_PAPNU|nr:hypothetical protein [Papaver nudicaule]MCL7044638.1 hypothetical protein [Papaver nudicaule]MCL7050847.1 hypothetical protein [Papaver nudicaule]
MAVLRSSSKGSRGSSSSNSKSLRSKDVSDPSLKRSKSSRSRVAAIGPKAEPRIRKYTHKDRRDDVRPYATDAMSIYNQQLEAGTKYELVEPGYLTTVLLPTCFLHHIDFTAKKTDVADAPEEMFFAELTTTNKVRCVKFCTSMGPKKSISGLYLTCRWFYNVQHPRGGGFKAGGAGLFRKE